MTTDVKIRDHKQTHGIIHGRSPPPPSFFLSTHSDMSPNIILRKNGPTKSNADFTQTAEGHLFEKKT